MLVMWQAEGSETEVSGVGELIVCVCVVWYDAIGPRNVTVPRRLWAIC